MKMLLIMLC